MHNLEHSGGLETLFEGLKTIDLNLSEDFLPMEKLIDLLKKDYLKEKEEMFVSGNSVRPGIIVMVNDTDWELLDTTKYRVQDGDNVVFISTLHGG